MVSVLLSQEESFQTSSNQTRQKNNPAYTILSMMPFMIYLPFIQIDSYRITNTGLYGKKGNVCYFIFLTSIYIYNLAKSQKIVKLKAEFTNNFLFISKFGFEYVSGFQNLQRLGEKIYNPLECNQHKLQLLERKSGSKVPFVIAYQEQNLQASLNQLLSKFYFNSDDNEKKDIDINSMGGYHSNDKNFCESQIIFQGQKNAAQISDEQVLRGITVSREDTKSAGRAIKKQQGGVAQRSQHYFYFTYPLVSQKERDPSTIRIFCSSTSPSDIPNSLILSVSRNILTVTTLDMGKKGSFFTRNCQFAN